MKKISEIKLNKFYKAKDLINILRAKCFLNIPIFIHNKKYFIKIKIENEKNKILIAGCDGYIGSELCNKLYSLNYDFEELIMGCIKNVHYLKEKYKIHKIDIRAKKAL